MRCKNCGMDNEEGRYICQNCGSPLYDENDSSDNGYNDYDESESDSKKKQTIAIVVAIIVAVAVVAGVVFAAASKKGNEETSESVSVSSTTEEKTTEKEKTTKESTTEESTTKETTSESTTKESTTKETTSLVIYNVYVDIDGNGTVSGDGAYNMGKKATLVANADSGFEFDGWYDSNGNLVASGAKYTITVKGDINLTAKFKAVEAAVND